MHKTRFVPRKQGSSILIQTVSPWAVHLLEAIWPRSWLISVAMQEFLFDFRS
jgi:hypothetical protein